MKIYCVLFTIFIVTMNNAFGEIKNGYEKEILQTRESLKRNSALLLESNNLPPSQRRKIEYKISSLLSNISNYELTANLLEQFKIISPDLYAEIDTLKDSSGRNVKVYVKFMPMSKIEAGVWGITFMGPIGNEKEVYGSEYGKFTVSIKISIASNALVVLAHELGHAKYQAPHFATYMKYYRENYIISIDPPQNLGHNADDLSGKSATEYVKRFRKQYFHFLKMRKEKLQSPLILIDSIRRNLANTRINI